MGLRFNPPPGWPPPPEGFVPPPGWQPDPSWPPPPPGWQLWVADDAAAAPPGGALAPGGTPAPGTAPPAPQPGSPGPGWAQPDQPDQPGQPAWTLPAGPPAFDYPPGEQAPTPWAHPAGADQQAPPSWGQAGATGQPATGQPAPAWGQQQPGWGQQPYAWGQQPAQAPEGANGFAITSFLLGIFGFTLIAIIPSVVFGIVALVRIRDRPQRGRGLAVAGLVLSGLWILAVIGLIVAAANAKPQQSGITGGVTHSHKISVFGLRTGNCFQNPPDSQSLHGITSVTVVPCTTAHNAQVFVQFRAPDASYPGISGLRRKAASGCRARLSGNVDKSRITRSMSLHFLYPLQSSWDNGHRTITCLVVDSSADLTSSLLVANPTG